MVAAVVLLVLGQSGMTAAQIHAEDSLVLEKALVDYWSDAPKLSKTIFVQNLTSLSDTRVLTVGLKVYSRLGGGRDPKESTRLEKLLVESDKNWNDRNGSPVSIGWFKPTSPFLKVIPNGSRSSSQIRRATKQLVWLSLPGYSKDLTLAMVRFEFNQKAGGKTNHIGEATVYLSKVNGTWDVWGAGTPVH